MTRAGRFEDVDVGDELQTFTLTLSGEQVRRYAVVARMPGGRFMSDEEARKEGLAGQIVPGNLSMALFSRLLAESFPGATLKRLSATFRGLVRPGHPLVLRGVVTEKHATDHGRFVECDLVLESQEGDRWVTGTASVQLPAPR
jgi:acyl dehydratase